MPDQPSAVLSTTASVDGLLDLARSRAKAGDSAGAGRTFAAALHLAEASGLWGPTARAQTWLAGIDVKRGQLDLARQRLDLAWAMVNEHALPAEVRGQVGAQLGQVLVFQGHPGPGAALMHSAIADLRSTGQQQEAGELELALAAICDRVDRAVDQAPPGSTERVHALLRRARTRLAVGQASAARADLAGAWQCADTMPVALRVQVGLHYGKLLLAAGPHHTDQARAVLQATRLISKDSDQQAVLDELLACAAQPAD